MTPDEPSYFDYLLGKNRAKLISVKNNLRAIRRYVVKHGLAGMDGTLSGVMKSNDFHIALYSNDAEWCASSGVPTNCLDPDPWWWTIDADATPLFKTQYASTSNGWFGVYRLLTNSLWFYDAGYSESHLYGPSYYGYSSNSFEEAYANASISFTNGYRGERVDYNAFFSGGYKIMINVGGGITNVFYDKTTNLSYSGEVYFKGYSYSSTNFDDLGSGYTTNFNLTAQVSNGFHDVDLRLFQKTTYYPNYNGPGSHGWHFDYNSVGIFKFDATNGFKYK
jgi:hypothetical protein